MTAAPAEGSAWYCAEVYGGREQLAADQLRRLGFEAYVPLVDERGADGVLRRGPLLPGYVLVRFGEATLSALQRHWEAILDRPLAISVMDAPELRGLVRDERGEARRLPEAEIAALRAREQDGAIQPEPQPEQFAEGMTVRIAHGPFQGFAGLVRAVGRDVMVELEVFGRKVAPPFARAALERVA